MIQRCDKCQHFKKSIGNSWGKCCYNPPTENGFPLVQDDDFCGKFEAVSQQDLDGKKQQKVFNRGDIVTVNHPELKDIQGELIDIYTYRFTGVVYGDVRFIDGRKCSFPMSEIFHSDKQFRCDR